MKCYIHPDVEAIGTCTICGKAICPGCSMEVGGKLVCKPCTEKMALRDRYPQPCVTKKEPALALLLSLVGGLVSGLFVGLGQIYNGQIKKGIILSLLHVFGWVIIIAIYVVFAIATLGFGAFCCLPLLALPFVVWLYAMYDAYMTADQINKGEQVKDWFD